MIRFPRVFDEDGFRWRARSQAVYQDDLPPSGFRKDDSNCHVCQFPAGLRPWNSPGRGVRQCWATVVSPKPAKCGAAGGLLLLRLFQTVMEIWC